MAASSQPLCTSANRTSLGVRLLAHRDASEEGQIQPEQKPEPLLGEEALGGKKAPKK